MDRDRLRSRFTEQFYRSLDESGVKMDAVPPAQLQALTRAMADGLFAVLDEAESEAAATPIPDAPEEEILWTGKPYLSLDTRYQLTSQRLRIIRGLFGRALEEVDLVRVRDTNVTQNLGERAFNIGDISIFTTDPSTPEVKLENVRDPMEVREVLRKAYLAEQKRRGLTYREEN